MIIDVHVHTFPRLGTSCGDDTPQLQLQFLQHHTYFHYQGWHRASDGKLIDQQFLCDGETPGISGMSEVNFRIGEYGRLEFTYDDENYWLQWLPPSFQLMNAPPELIINCMDYVGVEKAVLCPTHAYGELNEYTAECIHRYPDRFVGIASIREWQAFQPNEISRLRKAVEEWGLRGLHFVTEAFFMVDYLEDWSGIKFDPLWEEVRRLGIPIFWDIFSWGDDPWGQWKTEVRRLVKWTEKHPDIPSLVTHGLPILRWPIHELEVVIPDSVWELFNRPNIWIEVMLPGQVGKEYEYPYEIAIPLLKKLHQELGTHKLIWGSDMPTIERIATYRQTLDYLWYCDFLNEDDYHLLVGGNVARLLNLTAE